MDITLTPYVQLTSRSHPTSRRFGFTHTTKLKRDLLRNGTVVSNTVPSDVVPRDNFDDVDFHLIR